MKLKKILFLSCLPLVLFATEPTGAYLDLLREEINILDKKVKKVGNSTSSAIYITSVALEDKTVVYRGLANMKYYLDQSQNVLPLSYKRDLKDPKLFMYLNTTLKAIAIRRFKANTCFNQSTRSIIDHGVDIQLNLKWDSGHDFLNFKITEEICKNYDKYDESKNKKVF